MSILLFRIASSECLLSLLESNKNVKIVNEASNALNCIDLYNRGNFTEAIDVSLHRKRSSIEKDIDKLILDLKGHVEDTDFNTVAFSWHIHRFEKKISELVQSIWKLENQKIEKIKLTFASLMFTTMKETSKLETYYPDFNQSLLKLVSRIFKVKVRLFVLCDAYGRPDLSIKNYKLKVRNLIRVVDECDRTISLFTNLPANTERQFSFEISRMRACLYALKTFE